MSSPESNTDANADRLRHRHGGTAVESGTCEHLWTLHTHDHFISAQGPDYAGLLVAPSYSQFYAKCIRCGYCECPQHYHVNGKSPWMK